MRSEPLAHAVNGCFEPKADKFGCAYSDKEQLDKLKKFYAIEGTQAYACLTKLNLGEKRAANLHSFF